MGELVSISHLASLVFSAPVGPAPLALRLPAGWTHDWSADRSELRIAQRFDRSAAIRRISVDPSRPLIELLGERAAHVAADLVPIALRAGHRAGRLIGRTAIDGVIVEGYAGGVVDGARLIEIAGLYAAVDAAVVRAGLDAVLESLETLSRPSSRRRCPASSRGCT